MSETAISTSDIDAYFNSPATPLNRVELQVLRWLFFRKFFAAKAPPPSLRSLPFHPTQGLKCIQQGQSSPISSGLVVGTVRMGYGHHRIAAAACSWALAAGIETHLHDLLAIDSLEAQVIGQVDRSYSRASRIASRLGGPVEWLWGKAMSRGNLNALRSSCSMAREFVGLMNGIDPNLAVLASYPLNGQIAVSRGCKRVVNMVIDNHPQHFLLVPGAKNLVQSPKNYIAFRQMGVPAGDLELGGHWVHQDIVNHLEQDSFHRIQRARDRKPLRLLLPIGGAGAQGKFISDYIKLLSPLLLEERLNLVLNCGDHQGLVKIFRNLFQQLQVSVTEVKNPEELAAYCESHSLGHDPSKEAKVTLCHFQDHFHGFSATDRLIRVSDVLATKPSELAFCPIPKIHLRRVGDHEAPSALRSAELGDGTEECRTPRHAFEILSLMLKSSELLEAMNESILRNHHQEIYLGGKKAVDLAMSL